ncbi:MAG: hypothetical protein K0S35_1494, partial [Geminicoccaceae bacterium]|nr:hypothetical protein [Geminicoccaceae bacterium]
SPPAISCLGACRTPAVRARQHLRRRSGVRQTCTNCDVSARRESRLLSADVRTKKSLAPATTPSDDIRVLEGIDVRLRPGEHRGCCATKHTLVCHKRCRKRSPQPTAERARRHRAGVATRLDDVAESQAGETATNPPSSRSYGAAGLWKGWPAGRTARSGLVASAMWQVRPVGMPAPTWALRLADCRGWGVE